MSLTVLNASRYFSHAQSELFDAIADPEKLTKWFGPNGFTSEFDKFSFQEDGDWIFTLIGPDGTRYPNHNQFQEIVTDERVVYRHFQEGHDFVMTMEMVPEGAGTLLKWTMDFFGVEQEPGFFQFMQRSVEENFDRMEIVLNSSSLSADLGRS